MYKWLAILSVIILTALCGITWLGYHSIQIWAQGIEGTRIGEFAEVAEQIRKDVNRKLDVFMEQEQNRPYTDYQYYYLPDDVITGRQQMAFERSPLAGQLEHGLAYYNFQIQPDGNITTPNVFFQEQQTEMALDRDESLYAEAILNIKNVEDNLLPVLNEVASDPYKLDYKLKAESLERDRSVMPKESEQFGKKTARKEAVKDSKSQSERTQNYPIESLKITDEKAQVIRQSREFIASNQMQSQQVAGPDSILAGGRVQAQQQQADRQEGRDVSEGASQQDIQTSLPLGQPAQRVNQQTAASQPQVPQTVQSSLLWSRQQSLSEDIQADMVEIRIEPFVPVVAPGKNTEQSIFGGQVFMLRRVQIEDKKILQGFQLNEKKLLEEVEDSTRQYIRESMSFELGRTQNEKSAYTAILDFGFGHLLLNLMETNPAWVGRQINHLRNWYFSIIVVVSIAVTLAVGSLWLNARTQLKLAQKKDDFVSAVSHELRTPLTSIRMHAEMLEKNWIKSEGKLTEYYRNMRAESERLSRLIENVLDFSRIQRGRKKYAFKAGDINKCVADVVEMMVPYAAQKGFSIKTELSRFGQTAFDGDAVAQIVVNLLDNAIKYARDAKDKTITVRTRSNKQFILIEVEDHGPGIPHQQQKKIFEQFYRIGAEATRETAGSGLGLALVKKFAQAHKGFVEIINAKPTGTIFRVALTTQM